MTENNIILNLKVPSQVNFNRRLKEDLQNGYVRQKVYTVKKTNNVGKDYKFKEGYDTVPDFYDDDDVRVSCTRWFEILNIELNDFLERKRNINKERFMN